MSSVAPAAAVRKPHGNPLRIDGWFAALPALLAALLYARSTGFEFLTWDDYAYVVGNPNVRGGLTAANALWALTGFHSGNWHPLTWWSHMLDVSLWGLQRPGLHHAVNVALHAANAVLLYVFARRAGVALVAALLMSLLFAAHPLRVESVAWVSERKDLLAGFFWLLGMIAYLGYAAAPGMRRYLAVTACLLAALASKPVAVSFPVVCLILDVWLLGRAKDSAGGADAKGIATFWRAGWPLLREKLPWFAMALATGLVVMAAQREAGAMADGAALPLGERLALAVSSYGWYLGRFFWPGSLSFFYPVEYASRGTTVVASLAVVGGVTWVCLRMRRQFPALIVGWGWYLVTLMPMSGLVKVGGQAWADRYAYLTLIGVAWALVAGSSQMLAAISASRRAVSGWVAAGALALAALAALTWRQVPVWQNTDRLTTHALSVDARNPLALALRGDWLARQGRFAEAASHAARATALSDKPYVLELANLTQGVVAYHDGDLGAARGFLARHLEFNARSIAGWLNLALVDLAASQPAAAEQRLRQLIAFAPEQPDAHTLLGLALGRSGRVAEAVASFRRALALDPVNVKAWLNLGELLALGGDLDGARRTYEAMLRAVPGNTEGTERLRRLGGAP